MNARIKSIPQVGFTTRTGRRVYGQDDYDRDKKVVYTATLIIVCTGLFVAIVGTL